jgi:BirA family biotin operon repressor/biotin-[acetyl-CoA-carboxylase] ligase
MGPVNTMGQDSLERAVREAGIDVPPVWFDEVGSTHDEARRLAREGAPEWTVVAAGHQTAGRGRLGRTWLDAPGRSLLCSVVLRPKLDPSETTLLTLAAAVAMIDAAGLPRLAAKWPNDLVVGDRKVGGILAEAATEGDRVEHVVVGIGVNVAMEERDFLPEVRGGATSLLLEGISFDQEALLGAYLAAFRRNADLQVEAIVDGYRAICTSVGRRVRATSIDGERIEGIVVDINDYGGLVVDTEGGRTRIAFGEVAHLR